MIHKLLKDSFLYTIPIFLSRGIGFLLIPLYTRVLTVNEYGNLDLFLIFSHFVKLTLTLEIHQGFARYYSEKSIRDKSLIFSTAFWFSLFLYTLASLIAVFFSDYIINFINLTEDFKFLFLIGVGYIWIQGMFYFMQTYMRFSFKPKYYAISNILCSIITLITSYLFTIYYDFGLAGILLGLLIGSMSGFIISLLSARFKIFLFIDLTFLRKMLRFSIPLVFSGVFVWSILYIDRVMIGLYLSSSDVAIYSLAYKISSIFGLLMTGFQAAFSPLIYNYHKLTTTPKNIEVVFRCFFIFASFFFIVISLFSDLIVGFFSTDDYKESSGLIPLLMPTIFLINVYIFMPGMVIYKKTDIFLKGNFIGALICFVLNYTMIPYWGLQGAAFSTLISSVVISVYFIYNSQNLYYVPHDWILLLKSFSLSLLIVLIGKFFMASYGSYIVYKLLLILLFVSSVFYFKFFSDKELLLIKRYFKI
ncbi:oligosaccharide flippase family protein [Marinobacterium stanieri]|uniref:Membrane protein involved in the export of O-antigen and teichoic acid n=1 Tax=Marinobacterium stanieri TaxID=49186 RepID=A0A1N6SC47_9GAMM|nr:oligosaccharide flippase family protein [Marinobacterium stanieri]SIQ38639.1 Membrane protein involved in the export of O-antigen and teichoic acid [Marinobacterium stanieri]